MKTDNKQKVFKNNKYSNVIESLKDVGSGTVKSVKEDFINKIPSDFMEQLFGSNMGKNTSGEIVPGESLEFREVLSGVREEKEIIQKQISFEKLLEFVKSFRKKIEESSVWLHATNKRAEKQNYWSKFKKHGGKFLLSADHYLTRSAG